jgi:hypothetical protein
LYKLIFTIKISPEFKGAIVEPYIKLPAASVAVA